MKSAGIRAGHGQVSAERASHVAHVFNRMDAGGAELRTVGLVRCASLSFDFYSVAGGTGALDNQLIEEGHRVISRKLRLPTLFEYYHLFRHNRYVAVHSHLGSASGVVLLLAFLAGVPRRIAHFRSDGIGGRRRFARTVYLYVSRALVNLLATDIIGVSPGALKFGWKDGWEKDLRCRVIPNGYDGQAMRAQTSECVRPSKSGSRPVRIAHVARPLAEKNRKRAFHIWQEVTKRRPAQLVLVGTLSQEEERLSAQFSAAAPVGSSIEVVGFTPDVLKCIVSCDVLLVTSLREGLPGVVLEALALGRPVVASNLPGTRWISEQVTGITVCELSDQDARWADSIETSLFVEPSEIEESFDSSPFQLHKIVPKFLELWGIDD